MKNRIRGIMHVHSNYSFDGTLSLPEIKEICTKNKLSFAVLTEHADGEQFTPEKMGGFLKECESLSDNSFVFIPGLEYECERMHVLAIGAGEYLIEDNLTNLMEKINKSGSLAVLAHAKYYEEIPYDKLSNLDGLEAWNSRYDGRYSPSKKSLFILAKFREQNKDLPAYCGLDMHKKHSFGALTTTVEADGLTKEKILEALKQKRFYSSGKYITFKAQGDPSTGKKIIFSSIEAAYSLANAGRKTASKIMTTFGIKTPRSVSKISKKIFD